MKAPKQAQKKPPKKKQTEAKDSIIFKTPEFEKEKNLAYRMFLGISGLTQAEYICIGKTYFRESLYDDAIGLFERAARTGESLQKKSADDEIKIIYNLYLGKASGILSGKY